MPFNIHKQYTHKPYTYIKCSLCTQAVLSEISVGWLVLLTQFKFFVPLK